MSNYLYFQHDQQDLRDRFPVEGPREGAYRINGIEEWRSSITALLKILSDERSGISGEDQDIRDRTLEELIRISGNAGYYNDDQVGSIQDRRSTEELIVILLLARLRNIDPPLPKDRCPRLFISHRRIDTNYALWMAGIANQNGFAYWLDVLDPDLQSLANSSVAAKLIPLVTACIIEMALINCTHVLACMTPNAKGTWWIPYEYGRITELPGLSSKACAWVHPNFPVADIPEYMLLGEIARNNSELVGWLTNEWDICGKVNCKPAQEDLSPYWETDKLPQEREDESEKEKIEFEDWLNKGMPLLRSLAGSNIPEAQSKKP